MKLNEKNPLKWILPVSLAVIVFACSEKNDPEPQPDENNLVEATSIGSWQASQLKLFAQLAGRDIDLNFIVHDVTVYRVIYKTTYQDSEIEASGLVVLPKTTVTVPMISYQRGTIVEQADAPSIQAFESEDVVSYSALASMGFITAVPDMIGFAESSDIFHPYYIEEPTAAAVVDLLMAAKALAEEKNTGYDGRVFLAGYSQGGYSTLAAHKALEGNPMEDFNVVASFPGAGGYHINAMLDYFTQLDTYPDPHYLAYVGMSYRSYYGASQLLTDFFKEPYASRIPSLFNGINSSGQIDAQLTTDISALIRDEILSKNVSYAPNAFLSEKFQENSLLDWTPVAPIYFYHGDADIVVPLANSQLTYNTLLQNGANPGSLQLTVFQGHGHGSAAVPYIEDVIEKLSQLK